MTVDERIKITKQRAQRLVDLMEDPHPGLSTWTQMVGEACDNIAELSPSYEKKDIVFSVLTSGIAASLRGRNPK